MDEIEVVLDVRQVPDTLDLIVLRQKLRAVAGHLEPIGAPIETTISLSSRKARVGVSMAAEYGKGLILVARVQNLGMLFLHDVVVTFECSFPQPRDAGLPSIPFAQEIAQKFKFIQSNKALLPTIAPGETRDYYLPTDFFQTVVRTAKPLPPENYRIVAKSGEDLLGKVDGIWIAPYLDIPASDGLRVVIDQRVRRLIATLTSDEQKSANDALSVARNGDLTRWKQAGESAGESESIYTFHVSPQIVLVGRRLKDSNIFDIIDVVRSEVLQRFSGNMSAELHG